MTKSKKLGTRNDIRRKAEDRLKSEPEIPDTTQAGETSKLIHELRVHQVELEMQNEELRATQADLEESRARYADLYDFAPVGYLTFDEKGSILEANLAAAGQLGIERLYLINKLFRLWLVQSDRESFHAHLSDVFKTHQRQTCRARVMTKSGELFHARLESIFWKGPINGAAQCRTTLIDITLAKQAEDAIQRSRDELAKANELLRLEVAERKRAEQELAVSLAKVERSNSELQEFAFIASHDMQEPLRKISSFGARISDKYAEALDDEGRDYLDRMIKAAKRMSDMIKGLLDYSRVGTRREPPRVVDLTHLVREVESDLEVFIEKTGAHIEVGDLPTIEADPNQMRQLFLNIMQNALKFRGEEKPIIKVYAEPGNNEGLETISGGKAHRIFVEDKGIGFDEKNLDRIFTLFQRLHGRSAYDGTGMGLAICRKIVERHHGNITARSIPGHGATFIITLPETQPTEE
jgi:PAS domain S-box-containing protein